MKWNVFIYVFDVLTK